MAKMNTLDRIITAVSPKAGLQRMAARQRLAILNTGYGNYGASATKKSMKGWIYGGGSHKEDIEDNLSTLRQRCRDLYMGVPVATGAIKTMRTHAVGSGLTPKPQIDGDFLGLTGEETRLLERQIEREFSLWADTPDCDMERLDNFFELQQLAFLSWALSGDLITLLPTSKRKNQPYDLRVQLVEADRVCNPPEKEGDEHIIEGVEVDDRGEVIAYHICNHHPLGWNYSTPHKWVRVPAYGRNTGRKNVLHIMMRERIGQRRGVPAMAPVIESLKQLGRYTEAELVAAVVSGMFTVFIEKESAAEGPPAGEAIPEEMQVDADDDTTIEMGNGAIVDLNAGEKANFANPGRPSGNFGPFVEAILQQIGAALEIPYEVLIKHFSSSYSASRGALNEFWQMISMQRNWLAADFCKPIYEEWLTEAVAKGRIKAPGFFSDPAIRKAYCGCRWNGPAPAQLDPVKEVNAAEKRVKNGFSTAAQETAQLTGGDYVRNMAQRKEEIRLEKEANGSGESSDPAPAAPPDGGQQPGATGQQPEQ